MGNSCKVIVKRGRWLSAFRARQIDPPHLLDGACSSVQCLVAPDGHRRTESGRSGNHGNSLSKISASFVSTLQSFKQIPKIFVWIQPVFLTGRDRSASSNFLLACAQHPTKVTSASPLYPAYPSTCRYPLDPARNAFGCSAARVLWYSYSTMGGL